jgi:septum formation protein
VTASAPDSALRGKGPPLVLASGSAARRAMLAAAGVPVARIDPPAVDEAAVRESLAAEGASVGHVAETLAELKAVRAGRRHPDALVLAADQMLETADGEWLDKPADRATARARLRTLSGTTHRLVTGAALVWEGRRVWHHVDEARLTMRPLSDAFIDAYLDAEGEAALGSVGAYRIEGPGLQLFSAIAGDHFTILGLPLLPLLHVLRTNEVLRT